jgi:exopolyphosphatase/guanosine-5'-triphosphate,3'-diphosphate pyrophosphatase
VKEGDFSVIYRSKVAVKIGENGINRGLITEEAKKRALTALHDFKLTIDEYQPDEVFATATSAIRNAINGVELVEQIKKETGIETRIISGLDEAQFIYYGVSKALAIGKDISLIMDIGGGSIEFILCSENTVYWKQSFEAGGLRMAEKFHKQDPITEEGVNALENYLHDQLTELFDACAKYKPTVLIGSSGTFDTLSEISQLADGKTLDLQATELPLTIESFESVFQNILTKNRAERLEIPGMIDLRVDMIVVAVILIKYVLDSLDISKIRVSAYALKEGVLLKTIDSLDQSLAKTEFH